MRLFKATGLRYPINIVSGGEGVYILSGVKEKRQEWEIDTIVWVFQLLLAGIVALPACGLQCSFVSPGSNCDIIALGFLLI